MSDQILSGDITVFYKGDNNRNQSKWTGSASGTRTLNEYYSAIQALYTGASQGDDKIPISADTPTIYRYINQHFVDDETMEHLTGGSAYSSGWIDGTTEHVKVIGYAETTEFDEADIGRTILGATTGDTGTILDFNASRGLLWIRPDDPTSGGDDFDNGSEAYTIQDDPFAQVWQEDNSGGPSYVDETTDANSAAANDWAFFPAGAGVDDAVYMGFAQLFSKLTINVGTAGTGTYTVTWEYWNGSTWSALAGVTDGTTAFKTATTNDVTYTVPSDWARTSVNASAQLYYIRARRDAGTVTVDPLGTQGFIAGVGVGAFGSHGRHGMSGSVGGESSWVGVKSEILGSIAYTPHLYIFREDPDQLAGSFVETRVVATKGTTDWWGDGDIDITLKNKEADSIFGERPGAALTLQSVATFFARPYTNKYGFSKKTNLGTAGAETAPAIAIDADIDNDEGYRQMVLTDASGDFTVGEVIQGDIDSTKQGIVTSNTGTAPNITLQYFLVGDPLTDFTLADAFTGQTSTETATADTPTDVNAAALAINPAFGATTEDINNGSGARPYSIRINPASNPLQDVYKRHMYLTRRGSTASLNGQDGEEYIGSELQIEYTGQSGAFVEGERVYDTTSKATGIIVADHDDGATGDLIVQELRGTFVATNTVGDDPDTPTDSATIGSVRAITPVGFAPFGVFAGGKWFLAPGVTVTSANLAAGEAQAYQQIDDDGILQVPPNAQTVTISNLIAGDTIWWFRRTGTEVNKTQFTLAAGNNEAGTSVTMNAAIPTSNPTNANSKVRVISQSLDEHRYRYASYAAAVFTLATASTGTDSGSGSNTAILDGTATFQTDGVEVGDLVRNTTDGPGVFSEVVSVNSETSLTVTDNGTTWLSKAYSVNTLVEDYPAGNNAYVPMLERIADATSESNQFIYSIDIAGRVVVRRTAPSSDPIEPFSQDVTLGSTGLDTPAIRNPDEIVT